MTEKEPTIAEAFGAALRMRRKARGISQERLAELSGLHRTYISQLERGKRKGSMRVVKQLVQALDTTLIEMMRDARTSEIRRAYRR